MELGDHCHESSAFGGVVTAEGARPSVDEREQSDGVLRPESTHRLAACRRDRRSHEAEAAVAKGNRRVECTSQAVERRVTRVPEPRLLVEVVRCDEAALSLEVLDDPVVAATPEWRVADGLDVETPTVSEEIDQRAALQLLRRGRPHFPKRNRGDLRVRIRAWRSSRGKRTHTIQRARRC